MITYTVLGVPYYDYDYSIIERDSICISGCLAARLSACPSVSLPLFVHSSACVCFSLSVCFSLAEQLPGEVVLPRIREVRDVGVSVEGQA